MESWKKTFYAAWVAQFLSMCGFLFVMPFFPYYIRELGVRGDANVAWWSGVLAAAGGLPMVVFGPIWGVLADRHGRKIMVLRSMYAGALVIGLMGLCRNVGDLMALRIMQGILTGTVSASAALVASVAPANRSGWALGMMQAAILAGASVGPLFGGVAAHAFGYRWAFAVAAAILLAGALLVQFVVVENFKRSEPSAQDSGRGFGRLFAIGGFAAAILCIFQVHFASSAPAAIFPLYVERLCANPEYATLATGVIISVTGFAAAVAAWFLGKLSDEWGHKKMLITCAIIAGLVTIPQAFCRNVTELFILRVLLGAAAAGVLPSANAIIRDVSPSEMYGTAYGAMSSVAALGFATGPLAGGFLAATYGLWSTFILSGLLLLLVAAYAALAVRQTKAPSAEGVPQRGFSPTLASTAVTAEPEVASPDSPRR